MGQVIWHFVKGFSEVQAHYIQCISFTHPTSYFLQEGDHIWHNLFFANPCWLFEISLSSSRSLQNGFFIICSNNFPHTEVRLTTLIPLVIRRNTLCTFGKLQPQLSDFLFGEMLIVLSSSNLTIWSQIPNTTWSLIRAWVSKACKDVIDIKNAILGQNTSSHS